MGMKLAFRNKNDRGEADIVIRHTSFLKGMDRTKEEH